MSDAAGWLTREEVLGTWGRWLSETWDWSLWVTLTYDHVTTDRGGRFAPGSATHTLVGWQRSESDWQRWLGELREDVVKATGDALAEPYWFRGREPNPNRRGTHFHALVGGVPPTVRRSALHERWFRRHGVCRIEPYDPTRGAGAYVAKYVTKQLGDLTFSPNLGRYRRVRDDGDDRTHDDWSRFPDGWTAGDRRSAGRANGGGA